MSDIEILEDYLKFIKQFDNNSAFIPALENLIQENKELKEENNKLKSCEGILDVFSLGKESSRQRIEFDYIPKSKVKEKIEEYDKMIKATYGDMTVSGKYRREVCLEIKQNLQELLEGE